jgi:hypothetical protein
MSRNLARTTCRTCDGPVTLTGVPYQKLPAHIVICDAECVTCGTLYSAWLHQPSRGIETEHRQSECGAFYDLSYRSTFNDEPCAEDFPRGNITVEIIASVDGKVIGRRPFD